MSRCCAVSVRSVCLLQATHQCFHCIGPMCAGMSARFHKHVAALRALWRLSTFCALLRCFRCCIRSLGGCKLNPWRCLRPAGWHEHPPSRQEKQGTQPGSCMWLCMSSSCQVLGSTQSYACVYLTADQSVEHCAVTGPCLFQAAWLSLGTPVLFCGKSAGKAVSCVRSCGAGRIDRRTGVCST